MGVDIGCKKPPSKVTEAGKFMDIAGGSCLSKQLA